MFKQQLNPEIKLIKDLAIVDDLLNISIVSIDEKEIKCEM